MRPIDKIIIHCSATPENRNVTVEDINEWHIRRGFNEIGYHYVIYLDGTVHIGRKEEKIGAHCSKNNLTSIGVCYIGGVAKDGKTPKDTRTEKQKDSMIRLVKSLLEKYNLRISDVYGHYQFAAKACPSFDIEELREQLAL